MSDSQETDITFAPRSSRCDNKRCSSPRATERFKRQKVSSNAQMTSNRWEWCQFILKQLRNPRFSCFDVDPLKRKGVFTDDKACKYYKKLIPDPTSLCTILEKLLFDAAYSTESVLGDLELISSNAETYHKHTGGDETIPEDAKKLYDLAIDLAAQLRPIQKLKLNSDPLLQRCEKICRGQRCLLPENHNSCGTRLCIFELENICTVNRKLLYGEMKPAEVELPKDTKKSLDMGKPNNLKDVQIWHATEAPEKLKKLQAQEAKAKETLESRTNEMKVLKDKLTQLETEILKANLDIHAAANAIYAVQIEMAKAESAIEAHRIAEKHSQDAAALLASINLKR